MEELSDEDKLTVTRARKIQRFFAQPFHVAEKFTGISGIFVPIEETVKSFGAIIDGEMDRYPEDAFFNVGTIDAVSYTHLIMRDAVLHESNKLDLFGMEVNPGLISAFTVTGLLLLAALLIRIFVIPKFKYVPGKFQLLLEQLVGFFNGLGTSNSPHRHSFLNVYIFGAGVYIFFGTLFELFGLQAVTTHGLSISLPAQMCIRDRDMLNGNLDYVVIDEEPAKFITEAINKNA